MANEAPAKAPAKTPKKPAAKKAAPKPAVKKPAAKADKAPAKKPTAKKAAKGTAVQRPLGIDVQSMLAGLPAALDFRGNGEVIRGLLGLPNVQAVYRALGQAKQGIHTPMQPGPMLNLALLTGIHPGTVAPDAYLPTWKLPAVKLKVMLSDVPGLTPALTINGKPWEGTKTIVQMLAD